jgi:hypothetical protein
MPTPGRDRATVRLSKPGSRSAERSGARSAPAPIAVPPRAPVASGADKTPWRRGRRTRRPDRLPFRVRFRPQVGVLEQRALLSGLPTLTALIASTASAEYGQSVTFAATVSDLSAGGATPNGGTVTFSDQSGAIGIETLIDGVAAFTTSSLPSGTVTVTASYGGTADFAPSATGTIVTAAGNGIAGYTGNNGPATDAELNDDQGLTVDSAGDLFIADLGNNVIREIVRANGGIITVAGNGTAGYEGNSGPATDAELNRPSNIAIDSAGDLFIADLLNNVIREVVKASGDIITVAGNGTAGYSGDNGPATAAELNNPCRVAVDSAGDLFIADRNNNVVLEVTPAVTVTISPGGPIGGTAPTRTVLTAQPRPANLGRPVTLTATVKDLKHSGPTPVGSVTFLDGTAILGAAVLRHGKASLKTSSLPLGPNTIQAYYIPGQGFAPSSASVVENVRAHRSRSEAAPSAETGRRAVTSTSMAIRVAGVEAIPVGAATIVGGPTVLGPIPTDQRPFGSDQVSGLFAPQRLRPGLPRRSAIGRPIGLWSDPIGLLAGASTPQATCSSPRITTTSFAYRGSVAKGKRCPENWLT